jgi:hypothetical protein
MSDRDETKPQEAPDVEAKLLAAYQQLWLPQLRLPDTEPAPATPQPIDAEEAALREFERRVLPAVARRRLRPTGAAASTMIRPRVAPLVPPAQGFEGSRQLHVVFGPGRVEGHRPGTAH